MSILNPDDTPEQQNAKLVKIARSLMRKVEQKNDESGLAYQQFERAALLETRVRERTAELERALDLLQVSNSRLEQANSEIETARANLHEAVESINEGFALFDPKGQLSQFNSRFCRGIEDVVGHLAPGLPFETYVHLVSQSIYLSLPERQSPLAWARHRLSLHEQSHVVFNVRLLSNRWMQVSEHRTARGGTVILQTDVTEIMRLERQERDKMRDAQARMLQATLDHLNQGVCIFDSDARLVGWNKNMDGLLGLPSRRTLSGVALAEILDALRGELVFHNGFDAARLIEWSRRQSRAPVSFAFTRNGTQRFQVFAQEMPDRGFVVSFTDVTVQHEAAAAMAEINQRLEKGVQDRTAKLNEALAAAERANASKSRFMAAASHDLLQPLSAAKLFVSTLSDRMPDPETARILERTQSALVGAEKIIEALQDISRLDTGQDIFKVQAVRLAPILKVLGDELSPLAEAKGLTFTSDCPDLSLRSDPSYLRRILQNLIGNAVKYTKQGSVAIRVTVEDGMATIAVEDTGPGIAEEDRALIFREFTRRDTDPAAPGLGLGLAIVERAATGLGHRLSLQSTVGQGSRFAIEVPTQTPAPRPPEVCDTAGPASIPALAGAVVLIVARDVDISAALSLVIEAAGAEVLSCATDAEARALLAEIDLLPDVLLFDPSDPSARDDDTILRHLRGQSRDIGAVAITSLRSDAVAALCADMSVPLLHQPVDEAEVLAALNDALTGSQH